MPETASAGAAPISTSTSTAAPITTSGGGSEDVKITYGSPEGDGNAEETRDNDGGSGAADADGDLEADESDGFGDIEDFDESAEDSAALSREKLTPEQYKALKQALAANPELFKAVKREISENSRYKQLFPSPEAAREVTERIDTLGGIDSIEQESQEWSKVYEMFRTGDKGVVDYWEKDNPQALAKLFPHVYDRVAQLDPAGWAHKAAGTFIATAQQTGMLAALKVLSSLDEVTKSPQASAQVNQIIDSLNQLDAIAKQSPKADLTPEAKALDERAKNLKTQEQQLYLGGLRQKIAPMVTKYGLNSLNPLIKGKTLNAESKKALQEDVNREYARLTEKDTQFQKNRKALLEAGETDKLIKLAEAHLKRTMPMAAKRAWRKYAGISGVGTADAAQRKAEGQSLREAGGGGAVTNVVAGGPPKSGEIDWTRMRQEFGKDVDDVFMFGKKGIHGGKRVYFKKGDRNAYTY